MLALSSKLNAVLRVRYFGSGAGGVVKKESVLTWHEMGVSNDLIKGDGRWWDEMVDCDEIVVDYVR